jgi:replicative DNA helicase
MESLVNKAAEEDLIGILLRDPQQFWDVNDILRPESFGDTLCGGAFASIKTLLSKQGMDTLPVSLVRQHFVGETDVNLQVYLSQLKSRTEAHNVLDFVGCIDDMAIRRAARRLMDDTMKALGQPGNTARDVIQALQAASLQMLSNEGDKGASVGEIAARVYDESQKAKRGEKSQGLRTGLSFWDPIIGPMMPEDLIILGGATSSGKTALAQQIAITLARRGVPTLFLSHEMSIEQITTRFMAQLAFLTSEAIETGEMNAQEDRLVFNAAGNLAGLPLWIESPSRPTVGADVAKVQNYIKRRGIQCVVVDHLHYLEPDKKVRDVFDGITEIVKALKAGAKVTKIPWIVLSHLNRDVMKRPNKRPIMADLYGASEIEKSADVACFVHREEYWIEQEGEPDCNQHDPHSREVYDRWIKRRDRWAGKAEIILAKRRRGRGRGSIECEYHAEQTIFAPAGTTVRKRAAEPVEETFPNLL